MNFKGSAAGLEESAARLWRFAECEFDELRRELRVKDQPAELESKPLDLLHQLLIHSGELVTKQQLLESV